MGADNTKCARVCSFAYVVLLAGPVLRFCMLGLEWSRTGARGHNWWVPWSMWQGRSQLWPL